MSYRVKDTAPQAIKDLEAEPETIEVVRRGSLLYANVCWREHIFEEQLPRDCDQWPAEEVKAIMNNVARRLKVKVGKAKWAEMARLAEITADTEHPEELTELDHARIARAAQKRALRASKRPA